MPASGLASASAMAASTSSNSSPSSSMKSSSLYSRTWLIPLSYPRQRLPLLAQQPRQPQIRQLLQHRVLAQSCAEVDEVDVVEVLVLVEAGEDERLLLRLRVDVALEALRADLLHHALHRGVDRADADVLLGQVRREHAVARVLHRAHHPVGADGDDARHVAELEHR